MHMPMHAQVFSIFFGEIQVLIAEQSKDSLDHQRKMDYVNSQMHYWQIPQNTRQSTRQYFEYAHVHGTSVNCLWTDCD